MSEETKIKLQCSIPVIARHHSRIECEEEKRLMALAKRLVRDEPALASSEYFGASVHQGAGPGPALVIGDQHELGLYEREPVSPLEYRMALLAKAGDLVAVDKRDKDFEEYLRKFLKLDEIHFLEVAHQPDRLQKPVAARCRTDGAIRASLGSATTSAGHLQILPYLCTGNVWRLAQLIAEDTGCPIEVCGPTPRLSKRINDKIWFAYRVQQVIGKHATPPTFAAYGPAATAAFVAHLAKRQERVVVKVPDSAGSAGNFVFESKYVAHLPLAELRDRIVGLLRGAGWQNHYPVLTSVWDCDVLSSPSVQIWIPSPEEGSPLIEGIFEQRVHGPEGKFIGAVRAELDVELEAQLTNQASRLAFLFQHLGYFGRCSFDCVVTRSPNTTPNVHWIECNGRWGGVSIPMTFSNRLSHDQSPQEFVIVQQSAPNLPAITTRQLTKLLEDLLYLRGHSKSGLILLAPPSGRPETGMYFMALANTLVEAEKIAESAITRLHNGFIKATDIPTHTETR